MIMWQNGIPQTKDTQKPSFRPVPRKNEGHATRHGRHAEEDEFGRRDSVAACNKPDSGYHSCVGTGGHPRKVAADRQHNNGGYCESYGSTCGGAHTELACLASKSLLLMIGLPAPSVTIVPTDTGKCGSVALHITRESRTMVWSIRNRSRWSL